MPKPSKSGTSRGSSAVTPPDRSAAKLRGSETLDRNRLIATLTKLELEQIDLPTAAQDLNLSTDQLLEIVEADEDDLSAAVAESVQQAKTDPSHAVEHSIAGLNAVARALAKRAAEPDELTVSELSQIGSLLDKISALSEAKKLEAKADAQPIVEANESHIGVLDLRPNPDGSPAMRLMFLDPQHPAVTGPDGALKARFNPYESAADRKAKARAWLDVWFPLHPISGFVDMTAVARSMGGKRVRVLDANGTWHD